MPLYDYKCREHGVFQELAAMADAASPAACPTCHALAPRVILLPPQILTMDPVQRHAHDRNEKSRHEPLMSSAEQRARDSDHRKACGCNRAQDGKNMLFYTAEGNKMFPGMRPWMISH